MKMHDAVLTMTMTLGRTEREKDVVDDYESERALR